MNLEENIKLVNINKEKETILKNLVSLYLHDLSEFADDLKVNEEGKYEYDGFDYYFMSEDLKPFLIYFNDEIAGFLLLNSGKYTPADAEYCVNELFILKSFRGRGIATIAIKKILEKYNGKYKVEQFQDNKIAINFWKRFYRNQNIVYEEKNEVIDGFNCCYQLFNFN